LPDSSERVLKVLCRIAGDNLNPAGILLPLHGLFCPRCFRNQAELPKPDADGFITLFNGKDLTGWEHGYCPPGTKPNDEILDGKTANKNKLFTVVGGLLVASGKALRAVYTSKACNMDFHLKFEFRTPADNKKNNSCLFLRGPQL
jgi:hypothetical protein